jgi:hypothetical protein
MPQWHRVGAYDTIAERLLNGPQHDHLRLEYDTERAGSFVPLRCVPKKAAAIAAALRRQPAGTGLPASGASRERVAPLGEGSTRRVPAAIATSEAGDRG